MILVSGISLPFSENEREAIKKGQEQARLPGGSALDSFVYRRSLDARAREDIRYVYTIGITTDIDEKRHIAQLGRKNITAHEREELSPAHGSEALFHRPIVAGFGPSGMFAALLLAREGYRPIVLERGGAIPERVAATEGFWGGAGLNTQSNVQFGEGGAGTFSDGKLTTRIGDPLCEWVLHTLARFGAPEVILRTAKPHIGTDNLRHVVQNIRQEIIALGGEVKFATMLEGLIIKNGRIAGVLATGGELGGECVIAALGHSARDSFSMLLESGAQITPKSFSVGFRVEHLQSEIDHALYGAHAGDERLPPGEYQMSLKYGGRAAYTFCMCPGGVVVPAASEAGGVVVNGMSEFMRAGANANSALCCSVSPADFPAGPLGGVLFQQGLEQRAAALGSGGYRAPAQTADRFLSGTAGMKLGRVQPSYALGVSPADFRELFPDHVLEMLRRGLLAFGRRLEGFSAADTLLTGVESRTSSPVRIERGQDMQSNIGGLYPCGEGAGYAGGIMSAAVDGLRAAIAVIERFSPPVA